MTCMVFLGDENVTPGLGSAGAVCWLQGTGKVLRLHHGHYGTEPLVPAPRSCGAAQPFGNRTHSALSLITYTRVIPKQALYHIMILT